MLALFLIFTSRLAACRILFYPWVMFRKPRQVSTETELYEAAVRALMRRAYSVHEMKQLLGSRTEDDKLLRTVMDRLKHAKMIDDGRFAKQFARQRTEIRRQGKFRIARDLRARGVPDRHIEAALVETSKETDESAIVRQRLERKLRSFRGEINENKIASMYRSLLRAGFSADVVRRELKAVTREEVPGTESAPDD
jgi:regulatory protein